MGKKILEILGKNKLLSRMRDYTGFQKLLFFFIPIFCLLALFSAFINSGNFPEWVRSIICFVVLWLIFGSWLYLIVGSQVHWKERKRNIVVNVGSIGLTVVLIILGFF